MKVFKFIKEKLVFFTAFGFAKILVIIVPIWLADILSKEDYGAVEYGLIGLGMLVSAFFSMGIPGAYPYFILKKEDYQKEDAFVIHPIWLLSLFLLNQLLFFVFKVYDFNIYFALNLSYLVANQIFYSTKLKSKEHIIKAVILDSGVYVVLFFFILGVIAMFINPTLKNINNGVLVYSLIYGLYAFYKYATVKKDNLIGHYKKILKFSFHLLISSVLIFAITTAGILLVKEYYDFETVAIYALYFRFASYLLIAQRIVSIVFFKKLYTFGPIALDKFYAFFFAGIFLASMVYFFIAPYILIYFSNFYRETYMDNKKLFFIILVQMLMWMASALNSVLIDREELTKNNNLRFVVLIIISLASFYFLKANLTLSRIAFLHLAVFYIATMIQYYSLSKKKMIFKKSILVLTVAYILSSITIYLM